MKNNILISNYLPMHLNHFAYQVLIACLHTIHIYLMAWIGNKYSVTYYSMLNLQKNCSDTN